MTRQRINSRSLRCARTVTLSIFLLCVAAYGMTGCDRSQLLAQPSLLRDSPFSDEFLRENADIIRARNPEPNALTSDPILNSVTQEFGPTIIPLRQLPLRSTLATAKIRPWSSWWFPKKDTDLFLDQPTHLSTLSKYDLVRRKKYEALGLKAPPLAAQYAAQNYNPNALAWEGLCDAWAAASLGQPEPKRPVKIKFNDGTSVRFSISELKGLLLLTYDAVEDTGMKYYGQRFTGDVDGWIYPDLFPDQFHRFIDIELFVRKSAFIMDHDPGVEVWNVPVFKANYLIEAMPSDDEAVSVRAWLFSAEAIRTEDREFLGTREAVREYNYVLKGSKNGDGDLIVKSGYWVKGPNGQDARRDHPDYFVQMANPANLVRKSSNPEIEIPIIDEILARSF